jgi:hypothetical protein
VKFHKPAQSMNQYAGEETTLWLLAPEPQIRKRAVPGAVQRVRHVVIHPLSLRDVTPHQRSLQVRHLNFWFYIQVRVSRKLAATNAVVATQDRVFPHYVPNSSIKHSKSDSKDRSQEIL